MNRAERVLSLSANRVNTCDAQLLALFKQANVQKLYEALLPKLLSALCNMWPREWCRSVDCCGASTNTQTVAESQSDHAKSSLLAFPFQISEVSNLGDNALSASDRPGRRRIDKLTGAMSVYEGDTSGDAANSS